MGLADFARHESADLPGVEWLSRAAAIDVGGGFGYFSAASALLKVRLSDLAEVGSATPADGNQWIGSLVIDPNSGVAVVGMGQDSYYYTGTVAKVDLTTMQTTATATLGYDEGGFATAVLDPAGRYAYLGGSIAQAKTGRIIRIDLGSTTTSVVTSATPAQAGQPVTFTASVTPLVADDDTPTGAATFTEDGEVIAGCESAPLDNSGDAVCTTSDLSAGNRDIRARYSGDFGYSASVGALAGGQDVSPVLSGTISAPASVCAGSAANRASVPDAGPGATYDWGVTGGTITAGTGTRRVTFCAGDTDPVSLSVTVTAGGQNASR